jgi:hypothetical protein
MKRLYAVDVVERARVVATLASALADESPVVFAVLYGSFATADAFHDVDVGIHLGTEQPGHLFGSHLAQRLSEQVGYPVDVRVLNGAPVSFLFHALRGQVLLSRDDDLLGDVMERTMQRYFDVAPLLRHSAREAFAA